jgi:tRNA(Ile)-lysidine synthase
MTGIEEPVKEALSASGIAAGDVVLSAVSGGADSMGLLRALCALRRTLGITIVACHVDHGIRPPEEGRADEEVVRGTCDAVGIRLVVRSIPPGACASHASATRKSLEEAARDMRHQLLREAAEAVGARCICLGHTQDDEIETLLMRILQGSDVAGLAGIPPRRGPFLRPLLGCARAQVRAYLAAIGQAWREDPTNDDTVFLRNRVRHLLVPLLEKEFPGSRTGLLSLARKLGMAADAVKAAASRLPWQQLGGGFLIAREDFERAEPAVRTASLMGLYDRIRPLRAPRRLPWRFIEPALRPVLPRRGRIIDGHGIVLENCEESLFWGGARIASRGKKGYFIEVSDAGPADIPGAGTRLSLGMTGDVAAPGGISILRSEVEPPLILRSKRKGDTILLESGQASVKDLLAGRKVPDREGVFVLVDRRGVLAVLPGASHQETWVRAGAAAAVDDGARRMVVRLEGGRKEGT